MRANADMTDMNNARSFIQRKGTLGFASEPIVNVVRVLCLCLLKTQIKHEPCEPYQIHDNAAFRPDVV